MDTPIVNANEPGVIELKVFVADFAKGIEWADARALRAVGLRSKEEFQPGIGPHSEARTVELVMAELQQQLPQQYGRYELGVPYPDQTRQRCDLCLGFAPAWEWAIEIKMLRFFGDNGKRNDNILMHILSPYAEHRSALTDCVKLARSTMRGRKAVLIYGYDHDDWPLDPAIDAFAALAAAQVRLGPTEFAGFSGLVHPVHERGRVFGWEISAD